MAKKVKSVQPIQAEVKTISQALDEVLLSETAAKQLDAQAQGIEITSLQKLDEQTGEWKDIPVPVKKAGGIGKFIVDKILTTNLSNAEILNEVIKKFDGAKTTMACIAWYKTKMRKEGKIGARVTKAEVVPA